MTSYVLLVAILSTAPAMETIPFSSKEACELAAREIKASMPSRLVTTVCNKV